MEKLAEKHNPPRYLLGLIVLLISWILIGPIATVTLDQLTAAIAGTGTLQHPWYLYVRLQVSFITLFIIYWFTVPIFTNHSARENLTSYPAFRWKRLIVTVLLWMLFQAAATLVQYVQDPDHFVFATPLTQWLLFLPLALCLTPIQAAAEEFLFRAYLGNWMRSLQLKPFWTAIISGTLFLAIHLANPEIQALKDSIWIYSFYFLFGFSLMLISLKDGGYELAIGIHIGNNLFTVLGVNYVSSALPSPSLFMSRVLEPFQSNLIFFISLLLLLLIVRSREVKV